MEAFRESNFDGDFEVFLPTFSAHIDDALGGGLAVGHVTELTGQAGSGKTQLCFQLCANVQLPKAIGGLEGQCVYLDCNGGFSSSRLKEICKATQDMALKALIDNQEG